jgi:hypothetical protein
MHAHMPPFTKAAVSDEPPAPAHEVSPIEAKLRTATQYLYHSRLLIDEALAMVNPEPLPEPAEVLRDRLESVDDDSSDVAA